MALDPSAVYPASVVGGVSLIRLVSLAWWRAPAPIVVQGALLFILILILSACTPQGAIPVGPVPTAVTSPAATETPPSSASGSPVSGQKSGPDHIFIVVMENQRSDQVIGSSNAPYINSLARSYAVSAQYYGVRHPSLPNYLALISGSTQGATDDCDTCSYSNVRTIADQLASHNRTWGAYIEDLPSACYNGPSQGTYARRHNPWMYFTSISEVQDQCASDVPLTQFDADLAADRLPNLVWITPNLVNDMHDKGVKSGDTWLAGFLPKILDSASWKNDGVLFLVWDEADEDNSGCCGTDGGGHTLALAISPLAKRGYLSNVPYNHYNLLRTIQEAWGLGTVRHSGDPNVVPMSDLFTLDLRTLQTRR